MRKHLTDNTKSGLYLPSQNNLIPAEVSNIRLLAMPPMPLNDAHFGGFFYLWGMKPNTTQLAAIQTCIDTLHCLTVTNDITSPSHYVDTEMEVEKLELPTEEETALCVQLFALIGVIRKLK